MRRLTDRPESYGTIISPINQRRSAFHLVGGRLAVTSLTTDAPMESERTPPAASGDLLQIIGSRLRDRRKAARRTQREVARRVGITQASLSNYERGKRDMTISTLFAITAVLGLALNELVGP